MLIMLREVSIPSPNSDSSDNHLAYSLNDAAHMWWQSGNLCWTSRSTVNLGPVVPGSGARSGLRDIFIRPLMCLEFTMNLVQIYLFPHWIFLVFYFGVIISFSSTVAKLEQKNVHKHLTICIHFSMLIFWFTIWLILVPASKIQYQAELIKQKLPFSEGYTVLLDNYYWCKWYFKYCSWLRWSWFNYCTFNTVG